MARWIEIEFHDPSNIHKLRNCAEGLSIAIGEQPWGSLPFNEAADVQDRLRITAIPARNLRRAIAFVERHLKEHHYDGQVTITSGAIEDRK